MFSCSLGTHEHYIRLIIQDNTGKCAFAANPCGNNIFHKPAISNGIFFYKISSDLGWTFYSNKSFLLVLYTYNKLNQCCFTISRTVFMKIFKTRFSDYSEYSKMIKMSSIQKSKEKCYVLKFSLVFQVHEIFINHMCCS